MNPLTQQSSLHDHGQNVEEILAGLPSQEQCFEAANLFSQLADGTRLRILWILAHSEQCVNDVSVMVGMSNAAVSHHLRTMRQTGLLVSRRMGKEIHYKLAGTEEARLVHAIVDAVFQMGCPTAPQTTAEEAPNP